MQDSKIIANTVLYGRKEGKRIFDQLWEDHPILDQNDYRGYGIVFALFEQTVRELYVSEICSEHYLMETLLNVCKRSDQLLNDLNNKDVK